MLSRGEFKQGCQAFITRWKSEDSINTPNRYPARGWKWVPLRISSLQRRNGSHLNLNQLIRTDIFYTDFERGIQPDQDLNHPMNLIISSSTSTKGTSITTPQYEKEEELVRLPILTQTIHPIENVLIGLYILRSKFRLIIECFFSIVYSLIRT
ncbi:hypothetical protein PSHT_06855, partial [Puccinia striiformis]